jgi:hypothetical protein
MMVAATHASRNLKSAAGERGAPGPLHGAQLHGAHLLKAQPPDERDWALFEAVSVGGLSSRKAAEKFGISQTRVQQIRRHVAEWLAVVCGPEVGLSPSERICAAIELAERRCNYIYSEAMEAWRASQEPQVSTRLGPGGHEIKTTTLTGGDSRYLWLAMRVNTQALHILGLGKKLLADAFELNFDPSDRSAPTDPRVLGKRSAGGQTAGAVSAEVASNPPVGDCSPLAGEQEAAAEEPGEAVDVSAKEPTRSEIREAQRQAMIAAYHGEIETVHQREEADRERARQTIAAVYIADELRKAAAQAAGENGEADEEEEDDDIETDDEELDSDHSLELTPAELEASEPIVQVLRRMSPADSLQAIMAASQSYQAPEAPPREVSSPPEAPRRPLNRKERRARQRLLAKKLRKAK